MKNSIRLEMIDLFEKFSKIRLPLDFWPIFFCGSRRSSCNLLDECFQVQPGIPSEVGRPVGASSLSLSSASKWP